jgi:hypothetical protein
MDNQHILRTIFVAINNWSLKYEPNYRNFGAPEPLPALSARIFSYTELGFIKLNPIAVLLDLRN